MVLGFFFLFLCDVNLYWYQIPIPCRATSLRYAIWHSASDSDILMANMNEIANNIIHNERHKAVNLNTQRKFDNYTDEGELQP